MSVADVFVYKCPTTLAAHKTDKKLTKQSSIIKSVESDKEKTSPEDMWPKALHLCPGALMQQLDLIHAVCHDAIWITENALVMQHAWPKLHQGALYKCQVLVDAVKSLQVKNTRDDEGKQEMLYRALQTWLSRDKRFVRYIGKWVCVLVHFPIEKLDDTFNIGCWLSVPPSWTDMKCHLWPHCNFPAQHWWCVCSMCPGIDWEWHICLSQAMGHW